MQEINALLVRYCDLMDAGDFGGVGELFREGALADDRGRAFATGADAVASFYRNGIRLYDGTPRTKHLVLNVVIDPPSPDGTITARSSYLVLQSLDDLPLQPIAAGRYVDRFGRSDNGWTFLERRFFLDLPGDLSRHLVSDLRARTQSSNDAG